MTIETLKTYHHSITALNKGKNVGAFYRQLSSYEEICHYCYDNVYFTFNNEMTIPAGIKQFCS